MYILKNDLIDKEIIAEGALSDILVGAPKVAEHFGMGVAAIETMHELGMVHGIEIDGGLYFPKAILNAKGVAKVEEE